MSAKKQRRKVESKKSTALFKSEFVKLPTSKEKLDCKEWTTKTNSILQDNFFGLEPRPPRQI